MSYSKGEVHREETYVNAEYVLVSELCRSPITLEPSSVQMDVCTEGIFCPHLYAEGYSSLAVCLFSTV